MHTDTGTEAGTLHALTRLGLIFCGGAIGTVLRTLLTAATVDSLAEPVTLTAINIVGAFALGLLLGALRSPHPRADAARSFFGTGLLGGFTSYSALVLFSLPAGGDWPFGLVLTLTTFVVGIAIAVAGVLMGERIHPRPSAPRQRAGQSEKSS